MIRILQVTGDSLAPEYLTGDFVLSVKIPCILFRIRVGDIVVFEHDVVVVWGPYEYRVEECSCFYP